MFPLQFVVNDYMFLMNFCKICASKYLSAESVADWLQNLEHLVRVEQPHLFPSVLTKSFARMTVHSA